MWRAWVDVATNRGAPGVDGVTIADIEAGGVEAVRDFLDGLAAELRTTVPIGRSPCGGSTSPSRASRARPGRSASPRSRDRVVMAAAKIVLEPIFEADFSPQSFGFRPKRSAHQALEAVRQTANQGRPVGARRRHQGVLRRDRPRRPHGPGRAPGRRPADAEAAAELGCGRGCSRAGWSPTPRPAPRRARRSRPLLANIALHVLDEAWAGRWTAGWGRSSVTATTSSCSAQPGNGPKTARDLAAETLAPLGLRLHPDKTRIV